MMEKYSTPKVGSNPGGSGDPILEGSGMGYSCLSNGQPMLCFLKAPIYCDFQSQVMSPSKAQKIVTKRLSSYSHEL